METTEKKVLHTPGPWGLAYNEDGSLELGGGITQYTGVDSQAGFGCVAHVLYKKTNILGDSKTLQYKTFEANAKLIAAAPDMLRLIQEADAWLSFNTRPDADQIRVFRKSMQEIIKKATE